MLPGKKEWMAGKWSRKSLLFQWLLAILLQKEEWEILMQALIFLLMILYCKFTILYSEVFSRYTGYDWKNFDDNGEFHRTPCLVSCLHVAAKMAHSIFCCAVSILPLIIFFLVQEWWGPTAPSKEGFYSIIKDKPLQDGYCIAAGDPVYFLALPNN